MATEHGALKKFPMNDRLRTRTWLAMTILIAAMQAFMVAVPVGSFAASLEGPHVLYLTARAFGKITTLQVDQKLLAYPQTTEEFPKVYDETAIYVMPNRFRVDLASENSRHVYLEVGDRSLTLLDDMLVEKQAPFLIYQRLLRSRTQPQLMRTLNQLGVETAISSLGRVAETVVYVIGARYPDESVTQLAIDKETFFPLRLLLVGREPESENRRLEIFYHNWQKIERGWFPLQVVFFLNGNLVREIRVADLRLNPSIPADIMDLEALKATVPASQDDPATPEMENFQKKVE